MPAWLVLVVGFTGTAWAIEPVSLPDHASADHRALHARYLKQLEKVRQAIEEKEEALRGKLEAALGRIREDAKKEGDLETVLAARDAVAFAEAPGAAIPESAARNSKVKSAIDIFVRHREEIRRRGEISSHLPILKVYAKGLKGLQEAATKARRIDDALKFRTAGDGIAARIAAVQPAGPVAKKPEPKREERWISENASYETSSIAFNAKPIPGFLTLKGKFYSGGRPTDAYAFHTRKRSGEWVKIDLGSRHVVTRMEIYNRTNDNTRHRVVGATVQLSANGENWETVKVIDDDSDKIDVAAKPHRPVRYVRILSAPDESLELKHLKVFGWRNP